MAHSTPSAVNMNLAERWGCVIGGVFLAGGSMRKSGVVGPFEHKNFLFGKLVEYVVEKHD